MDAAGKDRRTERSAEILVIGTLSLYRRGVPETTQDCPETMAAQDLDAEACWSLGGAAGIAEHIHRLGGGVVLAGIGTGDPAGKRLLRMLKQAGIPLVFRLSETQKTQDQACCPQSEADRAQLQPNWAESTQTRAFEHMVTILGSMPEVGLVLIAEADQRCISDHLAADLSAICKHREIPLYAYGRLGVFKRYKGADLVCGYAAGRVYMMGSGGRTFCSPRVHTPHDAEGFIACLAWHRVLGIFAEQILQDADGSAELWTH